MDISVPGVVLQKDLESLQTSLEQLINKGKDINDKDIESMIKLNEKGFLLAKQI